ncbi:hypothetical protein D3C84_258380 [compost metagenome]
MFVGPDPVVVRGDESHLLGAILHGKASRQLGDGGGLAHPGRAEQGHGTALAQDVVFADLELGRQYLGQLGHGLMDGHVFRDKPGKLIGEGIVEPHLLEFLDEQRPHRLAALHLLPHQAGDLVLQQLADAGHLLAHPLHLLIPRGGLGSTGAGGRARLRLGGFGGCAPLALFG